MNWKIVLTLVVACTAFASAAVIDPGVPPGYDPAGYPLSLPIHYQFMINSFGQGWTPDQKITIRDAIFDLNSFFVTQPAFVEDPSNDFTVRWADAELFRDWQNEGGPNNWPGWNYSGALAMAVKPRPPGSTPWPEGTYPYNEIYLNSSYKWNMGTGMPAADEYDLHTVITHEVIHMLCVDGHSTDPNEVMYHELPPGVRKEIQPSDIQMLIDAHYNMTPEPTTLTLLVFFSSSILLRRRRAA